MQTQISALSLWSSIRSLSSRLAPWPTSASRSISPNLRPPLLGLPSVGWCVSICTGPLLLTWSFRLTMCHQSVVVYDACEYLGVEPLSCPAVIQISSPNLSKPCSSRIFPYLSTSSLPSVANGVPSNCVALERACLRAQASRACGRMSFCSEGCAGSAAGPGLSRPS